MNVPIMPSASCGRCPCAAFLGFMALGPKLLPVATAAAAVHDSNGAEGARLLGDADDEEKVADGAARVNLMMTSLNVRRA